MKTFEEAWKKKEEEGYQYGRDALEQVRFGWEIALEEVDNAAVRTFKAPKNGWLVACLALGEYMVVGDEKSLARQIDRLFHECDKKFPDMFPNTLIQVYELGQRCSVSIEPRVREIIREPFKDNSKVDSEPAVGED